MNWGKAAAYIALLIIMTGIGMYFGQPNVMRLDEIERNSLIVQCGEEKAELEKEFEKKGTAEVKELKVEIRELTKRNKDIIERNNELLEASKESNQEWRTLFEDFNASLYGIVRDVNVVMFDVNCWR